MVLFNRIWYQNTRAPFRENVSLHSIIITSVLAYFVNYTYIVNLSCFTGESQTDGVVNIADNSDAVYVTLDHHQ